MDLCLVMMLGYRNKSQVGRSRRSYVVDDCHYTNCSVVVGLDNFVHTGRLASHSARSSSDRGNYPVGDSSFRPTTAAIIGWVSLPGGLIDSLQPVESLCDSPRGLIKP